MQIAAGLKWPKRSISGPFTRPSARLQRICQYALQFESLGCDLSGRLKSTLGVDRCEQSSESGREVSSAGIKAWVDAPY